MTITRLNLCLMLLSLCSCLDSLHERGSRDLACPRGLTGSGANAERVSSVDGGDYYRVCCDGRKDECKTYFCPKGNLKACVP